jgi:hypothetical protein
MVNKTIYYYLILFAIFLTSFSFIPIIFEVIQQKLISNIPYISIILILLTFLIYTFIAIVKKYYIHLFFYLIGLISISILLYLKIIYNDNNTIEILKYKDIDISS